MTHTPAIAFQLRPLLADKYGIFEESGSKLPDGAPIRGIERPHRRAAICYLTPQDGAFPL